MTDKQLQNLINKVLEKKKEYFKELRKLDNEYEKRFGVEPFEADDDYYIDTFYYNQGLTMTVLCKAINQKNE